MTIVADPQFEELQAKLDDPTQLAEIAKSGKLKEFMNGLMAKKSETIAAQEQAYIREQVDLGIQNFLKDTKGTAGRLALQKEADQKARATRAQIAKGRGAVYNHTAPGAAIDQSEAKPVDMAEFLQAIWHHARTLPNSEVLENKARGMKKIQNSFGSTVPADGGFLIPEELRSELLQLAIEDTLVRSRAQVIPMSSLALPIPTVDETSRASSLFGGIIAYWTEEGAAITESQARFGTVRLEAKKLAIYCEVPNELVADADAFSAFISSNIPRALAFEEDYAFLRGTGVGQPLGVLDANNGGLITTTRSATTGVNFTDVIRVLSRLLPSSWANAVWLIAPDTVGDLLSLVNAGGTTPIWLGGPYGQGAAGAPPMTLMGRPVYVTEKVPANDATYDLTLIDFSHYLIGDRQVVQADSSPHFKFSSDKTAYKILERVDGRPWVNTPLTPRNSGSTLSPYVGTGAT